MRAKNIPKYSLSKAQAIIFINKTQLMVLLALALAPTIAILLFILYKDKFNREPAAVLFVSFLWGVLVTVPAYFLEKAAEYLQLQTTWHGTVIFTFFGVALVEEFVKFVPMRLYAFTRRSFDEPLDGIVHGVMVGLGFATLENIGYVMGAEDGIQTGILRMLFSVPGHAAYGVIMGYYFGKAKFDYRRRVPILLTGLFLATFFHGLYDSCLFVAPHVEKNTQVLLFFAALSTDIFAFMLASRLIKQHRRLSHNLYRQAPVCTIRHADVKDIGLIRTLATQAWPLTYQRILSPEQIKYMMQLFYSVPALKKQMADGHQFIIVYNNGIPVGFASFNEIEENIFKLQKIYLLQNQQGRGTGRFVIQQVIANIQPRGATALRLNVNRFNPAIAFYEKMGFVVIKEEQNEIGSGFIMDDFVMEKDLRELGGMNDE